MELSLHHRHHQPFLGISPYTSHFQNAPFQFVVASAMPWNLILKRASANLRSFPIKAVGYMETRCDQRKEVTEKDFLKKKEEPKEVPPPPEKPLPGDCCGSGCVRCVWDVYYEELEEYDKQYKSSGSNNTESKTS